ncbi:MAG: hypothetical protein RL701_7449 [Pseudomonadota bacterium]|jgi:hypothetical protein
MFRITKKLATALKIKLPASPAGASAPAHEWFADLFHVQGKKCVIWVHRATLLTFVRPAVTAAELREFHALFRYEFRTAIASLALPESLLDALDVYEPESYAATNDRAVVGSMLDYRSMFAFMVEDLEDGLASADVPALNAQLCETPMSVLRMDSALERVRLLLVSPDRHH